MIRTIVNISNAVKLMEKKYLDELFYQSVQNNKTKDITGILLYKDGTFIHILEGKEQVLSNLLENIQKDTRHNNIMTVLNKRIEKRLFTKFKTGLISWNNAPQLNVLETFLKNSKDSSHSQKILALLGPFLNINNTSIHILES